MNATSIKLATPWTVISHIKGKSKWVSSTDISPEVIKAFLKIIIQNCQSMAFKHPPSYKVESNISCSMPLGDLS